jgi:hypothetical protein
LALLQHNSQVLDHVLVYLLSSKDFNNVIDLRVVRLGNGSYASLSPSGAPTHVALSRNGSS